MNAKRDANRSSLPSRTAFSIELGGQELIVVSVPARASSLAPANLTPAEQAVARDVLDGLSNAEIARRRNSSPRTIANQLAAVYRKLGVASRAELAARMADDDD